MFCASALGFFICTIKPPLEFSPGVRFYARTNLNSALGSVGFTCLPQQSPALASPPSWSPYTPLQVWLRTCFHGFLFPIKQKPCTSSSGQPVSEVLWNVTQSPWEEKGAAPSLGLEHGFLLVPFFWSWNSPMHFCSLKLVLDKFHMEMWHYKCLNNTLSLLPKGLIVWTDLCFVRTPFHLSIFGVLHWFLCSFQSCLSSLPYSRYFAGDFEIAYKLFKVRIAANSSRHLN